MDLPAIVDPCGERGEFHTFVSNGPGFSQPVICAAGERLLREQRFMYCDLV
jgi:diphthamide synthase (EF-2-diphthine--ammonia ligase)